MDKHPIRILPAGFHDSKVQPCYTFINGAWKENGHPSSTPDRLPNDVKIKLVTWNIDYIAEAGPQRMAAALQYLHDILITGFSSANIPTIICLQEMKSSDLDIIKSTSWIQSRFSITDISREHWLLSYGTITLVDLRLPLRTVFRTRYASDMGRDALFVDLDYSDGNCSARNSRIRLGNTHLESLAADPPLRPAQVALASRSLHDDGVHGGVLVGDFNSIQRFDKTLHVGNDLKDAYRTWKQAGSKGTRRRELDQGARRIKVDRGARRDGRGECIVMGRFGRGLGARGWIK